MKKLLILIFGFSLIASMAFGDEVDHKLSVIANEQVRTHTRTMIDAGIHRDEAVKLTRMMIQNKYQNQNTIRAQKILIDTIKEGLPVKPVLNKAFEGLSKNAPEDLVLQAMAKTQQRYSSANNHARQITQNQDRRNEVAKAIAEGYTAGIRDTDAVQVMNKLQSAKQQGTKTNTEDLAHESFLSLRDMARLGVSSEMAKDVVCHAHNQQYSAREMKQLRHSFMIHSMNTNPIKLANQYAYAIRHGVRAKNLGPGMHMGTGKTDNPKGTGNSGGSVSGSSGSSSGGGSSGSSGGSSGGVSSGGPGGGPGGGSGGPGGGSGGGAK